ncbi:MAG: trypsin-like peptidase domain-containing protein [Chloroflexi bacterium]|nr:trypsin-like peptidase domain-containing protein [Chloroflexota bacterium]
MLNKVITGLLVFLVVLSGSLGAYAYRLNQQITDLGEQLSSSQSEQAALISAVTDELTAFRGEALNAIDRLQGGIDKNIGEIATLGEAIDENVAGIDSVRGEIAAVKDTSAELSQSVLQASKIYQAASQAIVRVTDGETVVGSGFIIDGAGHVVTAHHVAESITKIRVILANGDISAATVTGSSQFSDIAVLTLADVPAVQPLNFADSATLLVGQPVVTIGSPFNLTATLTSGVVSQLNGFIEVEYSSGSRWVASLIQFDAPVNPGNSGSPLLNSRGEVIGMVIARIDPEEGDGVSHAISSNKLRRVTTSLISQGTFDYPWLGVEVTDLTPQEAQNRGLDTMNGIVVMTVSAGGPTDAAGIKGGDIMVAIDGKELRNVGGLTSYLGEYKSPGGRATITIIRDKTKLELSLTVGSQPS